MTLWYHDALMNYHCNVNVQVLYGAGFVEYYAEEGKRVYGDIIPSPFPTKRMLVMKQVRLAT